MTRSSATPLLAALTIGALASTAAAQSLMGQHGEVVLAAGANAPGLPGFTIYSSSSFPFGSAVIDQNGTVLVQARLSPSGVDDRAIFIGRNASDMQLLVQSNSQAPGMPAGTLLVSSSTSSGSGLENDPAISPVGEIAFFGSRLYDPINPANTPTSADTGLFWGPAGGLLPVAREGDQVPALPVGVTFGSLSFSRQYNKINANGIITFNNDLGGTATSSDDACLFTGAPGALSVVIREGDPIATLPGHTWAAASSSTVSFLVALNDNNEIIMTPKVAGPTVTTADDTVLAHFTPGSGVTIWAREGDQAPGLPAGVVLFGSPSTTSANWNNSGNIIVGWPIDDGGVTVTPNDNQALWLANASGLSLLVREGDPTGLPGGETFGVFNNSSVKRNEDGTIAFYCTLRDAAGNPLPTTNDSTMVIGTPGNWTFLVREGEIVPEIPPSANGSWTCNSVTGSTNLNARGQLLFNQSCTDGTTTLTHYLCYTPGLGIQVATNASASYTTVLGTGTATTSISVSGTQGNSAGGPLWFNNAGDFAFRQSIDNGVVAAIVRGHAGNLTATPASIDGTAGGTQTFTVRGGAANANTLYAIIGSQSGTAPGTVLPTFGSPDIPLNFDAWTNLSVNLFNTSIYTNTLWFLDGSGEATASFNLPPGLLTPTFLHHACVGLDLGLMQTFVSEPASLRIN